MGRVTNTRSTSGDGTAVIAAPPAGQEIIIYYWRAQSEAGEVTILLKAGSTIVDRIYASAAGEGIVDPLHWVDPISGETNRIHCGSGNAVYLNLSDAVQVGYTIRYYIANVSAS